LSLEIAGSKGEAEFDDIVLGCTAANYRYLKLFLI
jgi:hypothetical protein